MNQVNSTEKKNIQKNFNQILTYFGCIIQQLLDRFSNNLRPSYIFLVMLFFWEKFGGLFDFIFHLVICDHGSSFIYCTLHIRIVFWCLTNYCWNLQVGFVTFFLSSILDNLTTTIIMVSLLRKLVPPSEFRKYVLKNVQCFLMWFRIF